MNDKGKCSYYNKGNHKEKYCMNNTINQIEKLLEKHIIALPEGERKTKSREKIEYHDERCHALKASC